MSDNDRKPSGTGHNSGWPEEADAFDLDAQAVRSDQLRHSLDRLRLAIFHPKIDRAALKVLAAIIEHIHSKTGTAWPSRKTIAEEVGVEKKSAQNGLYDLRRFGFLAFERRPHPGTTRKLEHFTLPVIRFPRELLEAEIASYVADKKAGGNGESTPYPVQNKTTPPTVHSSKKYTGYGALLARYCTVSGAPKCTGYGAQVEKEEEKGERRAEPPPDLIAWWGDDGRIKISDSFRSNITTKYPTMDTDKLLDLVARDEGERRPVGIRLVQMIWGKAVFRDDDLRAQNQRGRSGDQRGSDAQKMQELQALRNGRPK